MLLELKSNLFSHKFPLDILYTLKNYYIVGSNQSDNRFRILKIDRTTPTELNVIEDDVIYSKKEINDVLTGLEVGNRVCGGLKNVVTAYGIVGFIRFTDGYYISLITKRSAVALIGGHYIYQIDETILRPIGQQTKPEKNSDEYKYYSIFNILDLTKNFYFSYTYDITHTLQHNMTCPSNRRNFSYNEMFVWNHYLLETGFRSFKSNSDWILPIIHGFVDQSKISIFGRNVFVTLIARRSRYFAGARFLKRGVNDQGYVANDVETEQIVADMSTTSFHRSGLYDNPNYTSYVQHRGSIPLFWSQDVTNMSPKPPISINFRDPFYAAAGLHFDNMFKRYGAPIIVLNLIKTKEKNPRESLLGDEFGDAMDYLMQSLPEKSLIYHPWDMSKARKRSNGHFCSDEDVFEIMEGYAEQYLADTGFFHSGPEAWINVLNREQTRQSGVVRTNCIDCLDRTNAAQLIIGKCALGHQLHALGITDKPWVPVDSDVMNMLTDMYHDHGDTIAFQYGGSNLVNTLDSYRRKNQFSNQSRDLIENLRRYYSNALCDGEKQDSINLFLGNFRPQKDRPMLWELASDYYLHNEDPRFRKPRRSYIYWWTKDFLQKAEQQDTSRYHQLLSRISRQFEDDEADPYSGYWIEYYRPRLFTSFEKLFALDMKSTTKYIPSGLMNVGNVKKWFAASLLNTKAKEVQSEVKEKEKEEKEKVKKEKYNLNTMESIVSKSLNPSVSLNEAKEYKQYINQNKNLVLTPTLTDNNDPALTSHSDYHVYNAYMRRANLPNPITDIRVPSTDERVYEENLVIPKQYAVLQAVGSDQYTNSVAKSRYQAYETWLKTGKLVGTNNTNNVVNTKSKNNVGGNGKGNISKKEKEAYKDYKEKMKECQIKE
ncbi:SacI homology domain-containing protein [Gigaspora rosea]|uniref:SacI homology domain-containing protein n=1 Tax=Gigaspora rosea TaxID=44941 RepID=A0A397TY83_9GLOM|nr:SacI homology domain-containing protein [Gigaspora rosea]